MIYGWLIIIGCVIGFFYFEGISKLYLLGGGGGIFLGWLWEIGGGCVGDRC